MKLHGSASVPSDPVLPDNPGKNFWSVGEIFHEFDPSARCFLRENYSIGMHKHECIEINVIIDGSGYHYLGGSVFTVQAGDVFVVPPNTPHGYVDIKNLHVYHLLLHPRFVDAHRVDLATLAGYSSLFTPKERQGADGNYPHALELDSSQLKQVVGLMNLLKGYESEQDQGEISRPLTMSFLAILCRHYAQQREILEKDSRSHIHANTVRKVMEQIDVRYADRLSLKDLAQIAHMRPNYLCRIFREVTGLTPMEYVNRHRLEKGLRLLCESDMSVTQIALETGFYDAAHFSRDRKSVV